MKKVLAILLALTLMLGTGMTMASAESAGQVVSVFFGGGTPQSMDPALNSSVNGSNTIKLAFAGLMGWQYVDGQPALAPELAEKYTISDDKLTYTFTLRQGLKWSDGSDFKASDIVAAWKRAGSADLGADYGFLFDVIEGNNGGTGAQNVVADDAAGTLTVKLAAPTPYFLELCAFPTFMPVKVDGADKDGVWATKPETYIRHGPVPHDLLQGG